MSYAELVLEAARQDLPLAIASNQSWLVPGCWVSGPVPCRADEDVKAIITACVDNKLDAKLESGLVMRVQGYGRMFYLSFYVTNDGSHRFYEMSSDDEQLWHGSHPYHGPDETAEALRYLRTLNWSTTR